MKKLSALLLLCVVLSCSKENPPGWVDQQRLNNQEAKDWLTLGGNQQMQHYSPLNQINKSNVQQLGFAWAYDASTHIGNVPRGLEATPIVLDGVMYTSGAWGAVYALDARTGKGCGNIFHPWMQVMRADRVAMW